MKKLVSLVLGIAMLFAFASCSVSANPKEPNIKGDSISLSRASSIVSRWAEEVGADPFASEGWYKIKLDYVEERSGRSSEYKNGSEVNYRYSNEREYEASGKFYYSPMAYDVKLELDFKGKSSYTKDNENNGKPQETKIEGKLVVINGYVYIKTTTVEEDEDGKSEETVYESDMIGIEDYNLQEIIEEMEEMLKEYAEAPETDEDAPQCYAKGDDTLWLKYDDVDNSEVGFYSCDRRVMEIKAKSSGNKFKSGVLYMLSEYRNDETESNSKNEIMVEIKSALTGSVKKPSDAWKYDYRY